MYKKFFTLFTIGAVLTTFVVGPITVFAEEDTSGDTQTEETSEETTEEEVTEEEVTEEEVIEEEVTEEEVTEEEVTEEEVTEEEMTEEEVTEEEATEEEIEEEAEGDETQNTRKRLLKKILDKKDETIAKLRKALKFKNINNIKKKFNQQGIGGRHKVTPKGTALGYLRNVHAQRNINNLINKIKAKKAFKAKHGEEALEQWEIARNQTKSVTKFYLRYLNLLKRTLTSAIEVKGTITEIDNIDFLENEIATQEAFLGAYTAVTQDWINQVEETTGQTLDEEEFAMDVLSTIGTLHVLHYGYVSSFTLVAAPGLLTAKANEEVLEKQYTFATQTFPTQIETYANGLLALKNDDYDTFVDYYNGRIDEEITPYLDIVAENTDEAIDIFLNDIKIVEEVNDDARDLAEQLESFIAESEEFTSSNLLEFLADLIEVSNSIKEITENDADGTSYRATEQTRVIQDAYKTATANTATIYKDLAYEYTIKNDEDACKKWQDASCEYSFL